MWPETARNVSHFAHDSKILQTRDFDHATKLGFLRTDGLRKRPAWVAEPKVCHLPQLSIQDLKDENTITRSTHIVQPTCVIAVRSTHWHRCSTNTPIFAMIEVWTDSLWFYDHILFDIDARSEFGVPKSDLITPLNPLYVMWAFLSKHRIVFCIANLRSISFLAMIR